MSQVNLEHYEQLRTKSDEQFFKLSKEQQVLWLALKKSEPICRLRQNTFDNNYNFIINFQTKTENYRIYFTFDILGVVGYDQQLFKVSGCSFDSKEGQNLVYTIYNTKDNGLYGTYVDNYINIKKKVFLNEVTYLNTRADFSRVEYVCLTIKKFPSAANEKIIIDPESDIYKLYRDKKIDITTLCNLALFQANNNISTLEKDASNFIKKIDNRFI